MCSAGRPAGGAACRDAPLAAQGRSSVRCVPRPGTRSRSACPVADRPDGHSACAGSFFEHIDDLTVLRRMARPRAHVREAEFIEQPANMALVIDNAKALLNDPLEIDTAPAHNTVGGRIGPGLHDPCQFSFLCRRSTPGGSAIPGIYQPIGPRGIEPMHPVTQGLAIHSPDTGRIAAVLSVQHRCQRHKPADLVGILA